MRWGILLGLLVMPLGVAGQGARNTDGAPLVRAVLFYSPTCPHCEELIRVSLPPLLQRYGDRLDLVGISIATRAGADLYRAVVEHYLIPEARQGVPTLVIGSTVLVGGNEIPAELPGIIDRALAGSGLDWPGVPLLLASLQARDASPAPAESSARPASAPPPEATPAPDPAKPPTVSAPDSASRDSVGVLGMAAAVPGTAEPGTRVEGVSSEPGSAAAPPPAAGPVPKPAVAVDSTAAVTTDSVFGDDSLAAAAFTRDLARDLDAMTMAERFRIDPAGNSAAVAVMVLLGAVLLYAIAGALSSVRHPPVELAWWIPALALTGMAVAAYLAWVEVTGAEAVCGPVGDCNTVQQSAHARLLGVPVGLLGVAGYAAILGSWLLSTRGAVRTRRIGFRMVWWLAFVATLFSLYLTFLEPFVIGATCAWCLSSSVIAGALLWSATAAAVRESGPRREAGA